MHLSAWNQHGAIAFSCSGTNLIRDAAYRADLSSWFNGSGQGNASLNMLPLEHGNESHGHSRAGAWSVAACGLIGHSLYRDGPAMLDGWRAFDRIGKGLSHGAQMIVSQSHAGEKPLQLNGIRLRFLVPPHHQDFKHAQIVLANGRQDREFDDRVRRDRDRDSTKEDGDD